MVELVEQIKTTFKEVKQMHFQHLDFLIPSNALKCHPISLYYMFECFPFLKGVAQMQLVDREWRKQSIEEPCTYNDKQTDLDFWKERLSKSDLNGELKYGNLRKVVGCMLSLPFANAPVERLFSSLKLIKT